MQHIFNPHSTKHTVLAYVSIWPQLYCDTVRRSVSIYINIEKNKKNS